MFEHVNCETPDLAKQNLEKLRALFPGVVTEGPEGTVINVEALRQECSATPIEGNVEHYEFTWPGKMKAKAEANRPTTKTLRPCRAESVGKDGTPGGFDSENLYIEGDNLEVLKLLRMNYAGAVKMIYIDPPYNTGKDFVYRDSFSLTEKEVKNKAGSINEDGAIYEKNDSAEARYHTNWCNMMLPRLRLAKDLLRDDGVIFISIDDYEVVNARKICDEVFHERNMLNNRCFVNHIPNGTNKGYIARAHEYILAYAKDINQLKPFFRTDEKGSVSIERCTNTPTEKNPLSEIVFKKGMRLEGQDATFKGQIGDKEPIYIEGEMVFESGKLKNDVTLKSSWRNRAQIMEYLETGHSLDDQGQELFDVFFTVDGKPKYKKRLTCFSPKSVQVFKSYEFESLFLELSFENPKPVRLIEFLIGLCCQSGDIVVDFFSGSATMANSVMKVNLEKGYNIKAISVQIADDLDETLSKTDGKAKTFIENMIRYLDKIGKPHLLTEVGKERIRLAGGYIQNQLKAKTEKVQGELSLGDGGEAVVTKPDIGFRVLKLAEGSYLETSKKVGEITQESLLNFSKIKDNRTGEDLLFQVLLETDIKLSEPIAEETIAGNKVYFVGGTAIAAALEKDMKMTEEFVKALAARKPGTVFFRDDAFGGKDDLKISVGQIFKQMTGDVTKVKVI